MHGNAGLPRPPEYFIGLEINKQVVAINNLIPNLIGECCHGDTLEEVIPQLKDIAEDLVTYLTGKGELLPATPIPSSNPDPAGIRKAKGISQTGYGATLRSA